LRLGPKNILDELDRVVRNDSESAGIPPGDRLSAYSSKILSDLAVAMEVDEQVACRQSNVGFLHNVPRDVLDEKFLADCQPRFAFQDELDDVLQHQVETVGWPLSKFDYPSDKPRTVQTTNKMRSAEYNLDQFWSTVDAHYLRQTGKAIH